MVTLDKNIIIEAIGKAESGTSGEIRVHVHSRPVKDAFMEAQKLFKRLGMHRTKLRNGVLIFVSEKSHQFANVGDEGIHARVGASFWDAVRDRMGAQFAMGELQLGILEGVRSAGEQLKVYFPAGKSDRNELSDDVTTG